MKRRKFIKAVGALIGAGTLTGLYTWQVEPFWLEFVELDMPIKNLPAQLEGKTMMQISDMHVGTRFDWQFLINSFQKAQEMNPDIVVYTGDFVSYESSKQVEDLQQVFQHTVQGKIATVGVLGNHDYGHNWQEAAVADNIVRVLESSGVRILRNEIYDAGGLNLVGMDDCWGTNFHPEHIMPTVNTAAANVVLCHNPDVVDMDVWAGYKGWILSGHTHGGQCKPPFLPPPVLPVKNKKYTMGVIDLEDGRQLYINRALGHLWQVRFNVRPEITLFKLKSV